MIQVITQTTFFKTPKKIETDPNVKLLWQLTWYSCCNDDLVGHEILPDNFTDENVSRIFDLEGATKGSCYIVAASQSKELQSIVNHTIDLNQYDYFIESFVL